MGRNKVVVGVLVLSVLALAACAPGPNAMVDTPNEEDKLAGFWTGLWHGFASPVMFVISLFDKSLGIYEVHNNGGWYNFGFLMGASIIFGGSGGGACSSRKRKRD